MSRSFSCLVAAVLVSFLCGPSSVEASGETWRYYRLGNTGIQGDYNEAVWIGPDGDPYIGGYDPVFEEGGFSKFVQNENRWVNYSNVDYRAMGHPNDTGCIRVSDIVPDANGRLWMGTWRGALRFDPAIGPTSLVRFGPDNSALIDEKVFDVERAPDGTLWFANNGCVRYNPATDTWTQWDTGNVFLAAQPKIGGGYLIWSSGAPTSQNYTFVFDSDTQTWTILNPTGAPNEVVGMPGKDCADDAGNFWALRSTTPGDFNSLDYRRPNGSWVTPPEPYSGVTYDTWAFKAYGNGGALLVDGSGNVFQFNGTSWANLGQWKQGAYTSSADIDAAGNVWVCGTGGAAKRNVQTGQWQRYRVTNTSNFDDFNRDLTIDAVNGYIYSGANAGPGVGGMVRFDGTRWMGWNQLTYGLGHDWPFLNDYCDALAYRSSNGHVAVSPSWLYGLHEWNGSGFNVLLASGGAERMCEDSLGRLWAMGEYYSLNYYNGSSWTAVPFTAWGKDVRPDPTRPATVWAFGGSEILRTDGTVLFSRTIGDFPPLWENTDQFLGLAVDSDGVAWVGATALYDGETPGGALIRIDADTGAYEMFRKSQGWPFPGDTVTPWAVTPDGRLWMQYDDSNYPYTEMGLCWYDGVNVGSFPAPPGGEPQWGGLPHRQIEDVEVREIPGGYELWMSCVSRGIAVLTVPQQDPVAVDLGSDVPSLALGQNSPNPFRSSTTLHFSVPSAQHAQLSVFDVSGRLVRTLVDTNIDRGNHDVAWNGTDEGGRTVTSGVYFYKLRTSETVLTRKMLLLR